MPERRFELIKPAESVIQKNRKNQTGGNYYRFPSDLGAHAVILNFKQYQYGGSELKNSVETSSIVLPLPQNLQDSFRVNISPNQLGVTGAIAAEIGAGSTNALDFAAKTFSQISGAAKNVAGEISNLNTKEGMKSALEAINQGLSGAADITQFLVKGGLASIFPGLMDAFGAGKGTAINPYAALTFSGVEMKAHNFNWTFAPKSNDESGVLRNITAEIKRNILPETQSVGGNAFSQLPVLNRGILRYPNMVDIFFLGLDQPYFYFFKTCMINGFDVNYTPQGPAFLKGGKPAIVTMNMNLVEADIHTREDYEMEEWEG